VEIGGRKPGFRQQFLLVKKQQAPAPPSFFQRLLSGKTDEYDYIPINSYKIKGDSLIVQKYVDEDVEERQSYSSHDLTGNSYPGRTVTTRTFLLGTDKYGRDILSRLLVGVRVSLAVGRVDETILWLINVIWSIPTLLLVFAITLMLGKGFWQVFVAIGLTLWVNVARIIRGQVLAVREREFVEAARALGYSHFRILFRHILPNVMGPVWVVCASNFASAIVIEAGLSFLGVGVQPPQPSWGLMIKENYNFIITHNPMLALAPGLAIMLLVLAFNLLGNGLRDALDVRT